MPTTAFEAVRVARGLTQTDLAALCGLSQATISLLESGQSTPSKIALDAAATTLRVSTPFLTLPAPDVHLLHELKDAVTASARKRVSAEFALAFLRTERLAPGIRHTVRRRDAERQRTSGRADRLRRSWTSAPRAIQDIVSTLEAHGIPCFRRDLVGTKVNALVAASGKHRAMMFIDLRPDVEDATWAIAHELGHLALHEKADRRNEDSADEFAGEFLAPESAVREMLAAGHDVDDLPEAFAVPPAKFAVHARRCHLVTAANYRRLRTLSPPPWDRVDLRRPTRIAGAIDQRLGAGESIEDIAASAYLTVDELRRDYL